MQKSEMDSQLTLIIKLINNAGPLGPGADYLAEIKEELVPLLLKEFKKSKDSDIKECILDALGGLEDERTERLLVKILKNPRSRYAGNALRALWWKRERFYDHPKLKKVLTPYLYSENATERAFSAIVLYKLQDPRGMEHLLYELEKIHPILHIENSVLDREFVAFSLGKLGDERAIDPLFSNLNELKRGALWALPEMGRVNRKAKDMIINRAVQILELNPNLPESFYAAYLLCMLGDERGLPMMVEGLKTPRERYWAIKALAGLNTDEALRILSEYLEESDLIHIHDAFLYKNFENDPLFKALNLVERLKEERIEEEKLMISYYGHKIDYETYCLEIRKREERFKQMAKGAVARLKARYKGVDSI